LQAPRLPAQQNGLTVSGGRGGGGEKNGAGVAQRKLLPLDLKGFKGTRTDDGRITVVKFSPNARRLYVGSANRFVRAFDVESGKLLWERRFEHPVRNLELVADGDRLSVGLALESETKAAPSQVEIDVETGMDRKEGGTSAAN